MAPGSKLSTLAWWGDVTLGADLGIGDATTDEAYAAIDWLQGRQDAIERRLTAGTWPGREPSGWRCSTCPALAGGPVLPARGTRLLRDGKKGKLQIEYGLLADRRAAGRGPGVRGQHRRPAAFTEILDVVHGEFGLRKMIMVGDRGMITSAASARSANWTPGTGGSPRCAPAIRKLMAEGGPLQLSCSMSRTSPRSAPEFPASGWSPAATPPWQRSAPQARGPARRHREAARPDRRRVAAGQLAAPPKSAPKPARS